VQPYRSVLPPKLAFVIEFFEDKHAVSVWPGDDETLAWLRGTPDNPVVAGFARSAF